MPLSKKKRNIKIRAGMVSQETELQDIYDILSEHCSEPNRVLDALSFHGYAIAVNMNYPEVHW